MPKEQLSLESLKHLGNGILEAGFNRAVETVIRDMDSRPGDGTKRKVIMTLTFEPKPGEDGNLRDFDVVGEVEPKVPKRRTRPYAMKTGDQVGTATFQTESPDSADQMDFSEIDREAMKGDVNDHGNNLGSTEADSDNGS